MVSPHSQAADHEGRLWCLCYTKNPSQHQKPALDKAAEVEELVPIVDPTLPLSDPPSTVDAETKSPTVGDERTPKEVAMSDTTEAAATPAEAEKKVRAPRTDLEPDVKVVTDAFITGALAVDDGKPLTPHRIAAEVGKARAGNAPSVGAVSAVLDRWAKYGFAEVSDKPKAFVAYTAEGTEKGLSALKEAHRASLKEARAEAKAEAAVS